MQAFNFEQARYNMIEQQIRPWDVLDQRVLDLVMNTPRENFVPPAYHTLALADIEIPLAYEQHMLAPRVEARMLQTLEVRDTDKALEIGTGSGYFTALLAKAAAEVWSLDKHQGFSDSARVKLEEAGLMDKIHLVTADGVSGYAAQAPYDVIAVTGSLPVLNSDLQSQLKIGGRLFVTVGNAPVMEARLITRLSDTEWRSEVVFETVIAELEDAPQAEAFVF